LLDSAARSAAANLRVNLGSIGDDGIANAVTAELDQRLQQIQSTTDLIGDHSMHYHIVLFTQPGFHQPAFLLVPFVLQPLLLFLAEPFSSE
jgi:ABC-type antimicrobial peptide transport system ATPase subunit